MLPLVILFAIKLLAQVNIFKHNCTILEEVSFNHHKEFQTSLSLWVNFSEPIANIDFLSYLQSWNSLKHPR